MYNDNFIAIEVNINFAISFYIFLMGIIETNKPKFGNPSVINR